MCFGEWALGYICLLYVWVEGDVGKPEGNIPSARGSPSRRSVGPENLGQSVAEKGGEG